MIFLSFSVDGTPWLSMAAKFCKKSFFNQNLKFQSNQNIPGEKKFQLHSVASRGKKMQISMYCKYILFWHIKKGFDFSSKNDFSSNFFIQDWFFKMKFSLYKIFKKCEIGIMLLIMVHTQSPPCVCTLNYLGSHTHKTILLDSIFKSYPW